MHLFTLHERWLHVSLGYSLEHGHEYHTPIRSTLGVIPRCIPNEGYRILYTRGNRGQPEQKGGLSLSSVGLQFSHITLPTSTNHLPRHRTRLAGQPEDDKEDRSKDDELGQVFHYTRGSPGHEKWVYSYISSTFHGPSTLVNTLVTYKR